MGTWRAKVPVDDDDGDEDREDVHDECEEKVLGDQRNVVGRRRKNLGDEQEEHDQSQQDWNTHGYLLTGVRRQVEHGDWQYRYQLRGTTGVIICRTRRLAPQRKSHSTRM